jgi:hypothetical protein
MTVRVRTVVGSSLALVLLAGVSGVLADKKEKPDKGKKAGGVSVTVAFTEEQRGAVRGFYVERYGRGNCPPGLAKKGNGCLPPGQAKKRYVIGRPLGPRITWQPVPAELSARLGPPPAGHLYVTLDGDVLKLAVGTMLVVDAIDGLFD